MSTTSSFRSIKNKHDIYRGRDCMKKLCEYASIIISFKKKKN